MKTSSRLLVAAALLATLAACGNKGPLVRPSSAQMPPAEAPVPADSTPPVDTGDTAPPADDDTTPPAPPADGG